MAWSAYQLSLALLMVVTGSLNTLSTKWADELESKNSVGEEAKFNHPYLQACGMFVGEMACLLTFKILYCYYRGRNSEIDESSTNAFVQGNQKFNPLIFLPASLCDMTATSIMYLGLTLTYASSFQMLRGAVIVFTGLLSVAFIGRILKTHQWLGVWVIILGLTTVGVSDMLFSQVTSQQGTNNIITGDLLIIMAQIVTAAQMVYEEKFITNYNVAPLQVVGWEGVFGFVILSLLLIPFYFIHVGSPFSGNPRGVLEDALDGFVQLGNNPLLIVAVAGNILSIAFFNFAGVSVTKELSATTRMVLDSVRTVVIWVVSLSIGWQKFLWLQLLGFVLLVTGMFVYNDVILAPSLRKWGLLKPSEAELSAPERIDNIHDNESIEDLRSSRTHLITKEPESPTIIC